jgi:periplasmic protein TonB
MERPSHITFNKHLPWSRRAPFFAVAIGIQLAGFWLFTHGLATGVTTIIHDFEFVQTHDKQTPPPKPPEPAIKKKLEVVVIPPPIFNTEQPSKPGGGGITGTTTSPTGDTGSVKPQQPVIRAAVGIAATHTVPPYPPIARRIGAEGKVTFRLTLSAEGRVTRAEVLASSGRDELDQTAQTWILAHWAYKPALENGVVVASQVLATVTFSLADQR